MLLKSCPSAKWGLLQYEHAGDSIQKGVAYGKRNNREVSKIGRNVPFFTWFFCGHSNTPAPSFRLANILKVYAPWLSKVCYTKRSNKLCNLFRIFYNCRVGHRIKQTSSLTSCEVILLPPTRAQTRGINHKFCHAEHFSSE